MLENHQDPQPPSFPVHPVYGHCGFIQVGGETTCAESEERNNQTLDFCKQVLKNLQLDSYDKFEVLNLFVKFNLDITMETSFSKPACCYSFRFVAMACCVEMSSMGQKLYLGLVTHVYNTIQVRIW